VCTFGCSTIMLGRLGFATHSPLLFIMISKLDIQPFILELKKPFSYAALTLTHLPYALVRVEDSDGVVGYGEAALAWDATGETTASAMGMRQYIWPLIKDVQISSVEDVASLMDVVQCSITRNGGVKAGLEAALFDLLGKRENKNLLEFFSAMPKKIVSQTVLSFGDFQSVLDGTHVFGAPSSIKIKCGKSFDMEKVIEAVRKKFPDIVLNIDVNQGWHNSGYALRCIKTLAPFNLAWVEQPLPVSDVVGYKKLVGESPLSIMLDESVCTLQDVVLCIGAGCGTLINIKLAKCGGLLPALAIARWCETRDVRYMIGDMIHSSLGTAMNLYAGALCNPVAQDLTTPDALTSDPTSGVVCEDGVFSPPTGPGLGIRFTKKEA